MRSATGDQLEPELAGISLADAGLAEFRGRVHRLWQVPGVAGFEAALFGYTLAVTALQTRSFVEKASSDWWQRLCGWLRIVSLDSNTSADSQTLPVEFSGVLRCEVFIGDQSLAFDLPATTVSQLLAGADARRPFQAGAPIVGQTKLEPLLSALTSQVVALECCLDGLSMSLDQLGALQVNDILLLEHKLDSPLTLQLEDHSILGKGWLGRAGTGLALELCS
ncbi:MAG: FliM/FliN family flagellar motor switch protein [Betaproteobacteria bacterium]|nr:FliM/FliN family flagellar motor switch protein [Betaproteobacteria bacterium]